MAPSKDSHACVTPEGFTVLSLRFSEDDAHAALHQLCVKEHRVRSESSTHRPPDRTLFVLNVPPYCTQSVLTDVFSRFGQIQSVELSDKPGAKSSDSDTSGYFRPAQRQCFRVAYIVFRSASGVRSAKRHPQSVPLIASTEDRAVRTGLHKWIQQYSDSLVEASSLQQTVDQFMNEFDRRKEEEAERQKQEAEQQQEDEEGWVKVTKSKARPHSETANQKTLQREERKKKRKELLNFYSWQHRNTQREHIAELRKKFEEDKQRIAVLRAERKFRPF